MREKLKELDFKKLLILNFPYLIVWYLADKVSWLYRHVPGEHLRISSLISMNNRTIT